MFWVHLLKNINFKKLKAKQQVYPAYLTDQKVPLPHLGSHLGFSGRIGFGGANLSYDLGLFFSFFFLFFFFYFFLAFFPTPTISKSSKTRRRHLSLYLLRFWYVFKYCIYFYVPRSLKTSFPLYDRSLKNLQNKKQKYRKKSFCCARLGKFIKQGRFIIFRPKLLPNYFKK